MRKELNKTGRGPKTNATLEIPCLEFSQIFVVNVACSQVDSSLDQEEPGIETSLSNPQLPFS